MTNHNPDHDTELPDIEFLDEQSYADSASRNNRSSIRCLRSDILAYVSQKNSFFARKTVAVKLVNINSRGALVTTTETLKVNKKITLILNFRDGKQFTIPAKIVRHLFSTISEYGIKFDTYHNELGEHLLATQQTFAFK